MSNSAHIHCFFQFFYFQSHKKNNISKPCLTLLLDGGHSFYLKTLWLSQVYTHSLSDRLLILLPASYLFDSVFLGPGCSLWFSEFNKFCSPVTANKYFLKISNPQYLFPGKQLFPQCLFPGKQILPLGKKVVLRCASRDGKEIK